MAGKIPIVTSSKEETAKKFKGTYRNIDESVFDFWKERDDVVEADVIKWHKINGRCGFFTPVTVNSF